MFFLFCVGLATSKIKDKSVDLKILLQFGGILKFARKFDSCQLY